MKRRILLLAIAMLWMAVPAVHAEAIEQNKMDALFLASWQPDAQGISRPPLSRELAVWSAEFSKASYVYTSGPEVYFDAGFTDVTYVGSRSIIASASQQSNALSTLLFYQRVESYVDSSLSACKTFVSGRRISPEKAVISIVFTGTKKLPDWVNNLVFTPIDGLHEGFFAMAMDFDHMADRIFFPELSQQLGEEKVLSLSDVLTECAKPDSRFLLWITGHSRGAAVAQCYIANALHRRDLQPQHILAYTFASPTVADADYAYDVADYPIYNIVNSDDIMTKVGAQMRLGVDLVFTPDSAFRDKWYDNYPFIRSNLLVLARLEDMTCAIEYLAALQESLDPALGGILGTTLQALKKQPFVDFDPDALYKRYTGLDSPDASRVAYYCGLLEEANADIPNLLDQFSAITESLRQAHQMDRETESRDSAYMALTKESFGTLLPFIWQKGTQGEMPSRIPLPQEEVRHLAGDFSQSTQWR